MESYDVLTVENIREGRLDGLTHLQNTNFLRLIMSHVITVHILSKKRKVKNCRGIEKGRVSGDYKDDFVKK